MKACRLRPTSSPLLLLLRPQPSPRTLLPTAPRRHHHRTFFSAAAAADPRNKTQVYISRSHDPILNLSLEHHLLQTTAADTTVLLLYANDPCVVLGRNQNPWIEADLARLAVTDSSVCLVRRRSGGGTVFHDGGNVNFAVICPPRAFERDTHAEMVVRALAALGRPDARVNERHDIVVGGGGESAQEEIFKVSGSAYKLTRLRALHHGTCLLDSPNVDTIGTLLRSPARAFVRARGVDSVRSPVRNLGLGVDEFCDAVAHEFETLYGKPDVRAEVADRDEDVMAVEAVRRGCEELRSRDWLYGQTPRFTFCTHPHEQDERARPKVPFEERIHFEANKGIVERFLVESTFGARSDLSGLVGTALCDVDDWSARLSEGGLSDQQATQMGGWLNQILGVEFTRDSKGKSV